MTEFGFVGLYLAAGAAIATWHNWRYAQVTGRPLRGVDHALAVGVTCLWPLVLVAIVPVLVVERIVGVSFREWRP